MKSLSALYRRGVKELSEAGIESADFDAMCLLEDCFSISRAEYYLRQDYLPSSEQAEEYQKLITRRKNYEPLQYILGKWSFHQSEFFVGEGVLIPRPETEMLVDMAVDEIGKNNHKICFDLCAGSGCIGLSIARLCPDTEFFLFEKYDEAIYYLEKNISAHSLSNVRLVKYDILKGFDSETFPRPDLIVSNPPYISSGELSTLQKEVQREPMTALDGGEDGLLFYAAISKLWATKIPPPLRLMFETGEGQPEQIAEKLRQEGFGVKLEKDMYSVERFVFAEI